MNQLKLLKIVKMASFNSENWSHFVGSSLIAKPGNTDLITGARKIPNRIYVGALSEETTEQDLQRFFSEFGSVTNAKIITDKQGRTRGYGFVTFKTIEEAQRVQELPCELILNEKKLIIRPAIKRSPNLAITPPTLPAMRTETLEIDPLMYQPTMMPYYGYRALSFPYIPCPPAANYQSYQF